MPTVWTIGYERLLPPAARRRAGGGAACERVIDVRYRPQSRRPGMSKTRLGDLLAAHDIAYEHRKPLGTPPDLRHDFHHGRTEQARAGFRAHVEANAAEALDALADELAHGPRTALLCLEEDPGRLPPPRAHRDRSPSACPGSTVVDL